MNIHRTFLTKRMEYQRRKNDVVGEVLSAEDIVRMNRRSDVVSYATLAEINHFQKERARDFRKMMNTFLQGQIDFHEQAAKALRTAQESFREAESFESTAHNELPADKQYLS